MYDYRATDTAALEPLSLDGDALDPIGGGGALIGYAGVSTRDQNLDRQTRALKAAGCKKVFSDRKSGKDVEREQLAKCLDYMRAGDTLVVASLDRLGRSLQDLISIVADLRWRGIGFPNATIRSPAVLRRARPMAGHRCSMPRSTSGITWSNVASTGSNSSVAWQPVTPNVPLTTRQNSP
ncbi:recombinase family protein [Nocardia sp. NPDC001965]